MEIGVVCPKAIQLKTLLTSGVLQIRAGSCLKAGVALPGSKLGHVRVAGPQEQSVAGCLCLLLKNPPATAGTEPVPPHVGK